MKSIINQSYTLLLALALVGCLCSCNKRNDASNAQASNISYTPCLSSISASDSKNVFGEEDSLNISYRNQTIFVTHYNLMVNCGFEQEGIAVDVSTHADTITIREQEAGSLLANCICLTHNSFSIGPVPHGTYTLVFINWHTPNVSNTRTLTF